MRGVDVVAGIAVKKVPNSRGRQGLPVSKVGNIKARQTTSSKVRSNISVKKSPMKKGDKQQGINILKTKCNNSSEPFKHRFLVHRIRDLTFNQDQIDYQKNQDQIGWINDAGFVSLLVMFDISIPMELVSWIMKHINPDLRELRIKKKVIVFDKQLVCNTLGVPSGADPVKLSCTPDEYDAYLKIREPFMGGVRGLSLSDCIEASKKANDKIAFIRAFMLVALGFVLCPGTDNSITARYLHSFEDVSKIKSFDWLASFLTS